jgi:dinuclear metal center YbgI/SA1388 family protein
MEKLQRIVDHLDEFLARGDFSDNSQNGIQVDGKRQVKRIAGMVDASVEGFSAAADAGADMVIVHHGLLWSKPIVLAGPMFDRVKTLIDNGLSLYAAHLPLDAHPEVGNNIRLLDLVGADLKQWYAEWGGKPIGCLGTFSTPKPLEDIVEILDKGLSTSTRVLDFGVPEITTVGIISGSACEAVPVSKEAGAELFITGEPRLSAFHEAQELELNVAFAGHYATECVGVKALLERLTEWFDVETLFIDIPCDI